MSIQKQKRTSLKALNFIGVLSGLASGIWIGSSYAPTQLVTLNISPFVISGAMVIGVFVALAFSTVIPPLEVNHFWFIVLIFACISSLIGVGWLLKKHTGFS